MLVNVLGQISVLSGTLHTFYLIFLFFTQSSWTMNSSPVSSGPGLFSLKERIQILFAHFHNDWANSADHLIRGENSWSGISILNRVIESLHCSKSASLQRCCSQRSSTPTKQTNLRHKENSRLFFFTLRLMLEITLIIECIMGCPWELCFFPEWRPTPYLLLMSLWEALVSIIIYISICRSTPLLFELWNWHYWTFLCGRLSAQEQFLGTPVT